MFKRYQQITHDIVGLVNAPRAVKGRLRDGLAPRPIRDLLIQLAHSTAQNQLAGGTLAEASLRLAGGKLLITAQGRWFGALTDDDLAVATIDGSAFLDDDRLPAHIAWHRQLYQEANTRVILFLQPIDLLALAYHGLLPDDAMLPAARDNIGPLWLADTLPDVAARPQDGRVVVIKGQGVVIWSDNAESIFAQAQLLAHWARLTRIARQINRP